jgi:hypothetical protein
LGVSIAANNRENSSASGPPGCTGADRGGATGSGCRGARVVASGCGAACPGFAQAGIFQALTLVRSCGLDTLSTAILAFNPTIHWRSGGFPASTSVMM